MIKSKRAAGGLKDFCAFLLIALRYFRGWTLGLELWISTTQALSIGGSRLPLLNIAGGKDR